MRILIVDDDDDARDITEAMLKASHLRDVVKASSAWEAFKILDLGQDTRQTPTVDIILLDIVMPGMDGAEACARIRRDERYADIPIIMVTSLGDDETLSNAFAAGATDYVIKPAKPIELVARVRAAMRIKGELDRRVARERELVSFLASWGQRRSAIWVDDVTGLFVGEVAEAYLSAMEGPGLDNCISVLSATVDNLAAYRSTRGEFAARAVLAQVAQVIMGVPATVGVVAAAYRDGPIVLVAPDWELEPSADLAQKLSHAIAQRPFLAPGGELPERFTASVAVVTGRLGTGTDGAVLLARAISAAQAASRAGGNRVVCMHKGRQGPIGMLESASETVLR
jgi:PleD family two-component response regulator